MLRRTIIYRVAVIPVLSQVDAKRLHQSQKHVVHRIERYSDEFIEIQQKIASRRLTERDSMRFQERLLLHSGPCPFRINTRFKPLTGMRREHPMSLSTDTVLVLPLFGVVPLLLSRDSRCGFVGVLFIKCGGVVRPLSGHEDL